MNNIEDSKSIEFENRSQELTQEMSLKDITSLMVINWPLFLVLTLMITTVGLVIYTIQNPYISKTTIIINDAQNSHLQAFTKNILGQGAQVNEAKKNNSSVQKSLEYFKTIDFLQKIANKTTDAAYNTQISLGEKQGLKIWQAEYSKTTDKLTEDEQIQIYKKIDGMLSFKIKSDYSVDVLVQSDSKELALYISNVAAAVALESFKEVESKDIQQMNDFLQTEKKSVDTEILDLNKKMQAFNEKPENLISLSSREKVGEYLSELMVRKNETLMKISENNKIVTALTGNSAGNSTVKRESQLYGNSGKAQGLKLENDLLRAKLGQIQTAIDHVSDEAKAMPVAAQMYDELQKRSDQQVSRYKDISAALAKVEALKLSLVNKFEIYEKSRLDKVAPAVSLTVVLFLSFILSQLLGSLVIYLRAIWDTRLITAQSTRNVVVIDSHSLDPRVIIENSKIKFRLKSSSITDDPENGKTKRLGFDFSSKDKNG